MARPTGGLMWPRGERDGGTPGGGGGDFYWIDPAHPDTPADATPRAGDDDFVVGSTLDTVGTRHSGADAWTIINNDGSAANISIVDETLHLSNVGTAAMDPTLVVLPLAVGDFTRRATVWMSTALGGNYQGVGIALRESATGKLLCFGPAYDLGPKIQVRRLTSLTGWTANYNLANPWAFVNGHAAYLEVSRAGSDLTFRYSTNGRAWAASSAIAQTADFTTAPDQIGLWTNDGNGVIKYIHDLT